MGNEYEGGTIGSGKIIIISVAVKIFEICDCISKIFILGIGPPILLSLALCSLGYKTMQNLEVKQVGRIIEPLLDKLDYSWTMVKVTQSILKVKVYL